jgi:hypothetical protein
MSESFRENWKTTTFVGFSFLATALIFKTPEFQPYLPRRSQVLELTGSLGRAADLFSILFCSCPWFSPVSPLYPA